MTTSIVRGFIAGMILVAVGSVILRGVLYILTRVITLF